MNPVHFSSEDQTWQTPRSVFDPLNAEFKFTLDAAASASNHMLPRYCAADDDGAAIYDGLLLPWRGERVWCNPPYGRGMDKWIAKLASGEAELAVGFIPARTDTKWFHNYVLDKAEIRFIKGRVKFVGATSCAPFPSMICVWRRP